MVVLTAPKAIVQIPELEHRSDRLRQREQSCARAVTDRPALVRRATRWATRQHRRPDAVIVGGEVSSNSSPSIFRSRIGRYGTSALDHPGLMPANLTTLPHFSVSSAISFSKSAGEPPSTLMPMSVSRPLNLGSASAALIS